MPEAFQFVVALTGDEIVEALRLYATTKGREVPVVGKVTLSGLYGGMPGDDVLLRMTIDVPETVLLPYVPHYTEGMPDWAM